MFVQLELIKIAIRVLLSEMRNMQMTQLCLLLFTHTASELSKADSDVTCLLSLQRDLCTSRPLLAVSTAAGGT